jgi:hypothetical protein
MVVLPLNEPDHRIKVWVWPINSRQDPLIFNFEQDQHAESVSFGMRVADSWRDVSRVQVVDARGMELARYTAAWVYLGVEKFNDKKMGRRPTQPEFPEFRSITTGGGE